MSILPATSVGLLLHHGGRYRGWRAGDPHTSTGINNRNRIASAQSRGLMNLHGLSVARLEARDRVI